MTRIGWHWLAGLLVLALLALPAHAKGVGRDAQLAVLEAPEGTLLEDILSGEARVGFTPLLTPGATVRLHKNKATWVRLRVDLPERMAGEWVLRLERTPLPQVRVFALEAPREVLAEFGFFQPMARVADAVGGFRVPVPAGAAGELEWYLEIRGDLRVGVMPQFLPGDQAAIADASNARWLNASVAGVALVFVLALVRFAPRPSSGAGSVAFAAAGVVLALLAWSGAVYALPLGGDLAGFGAMGLWALLLLPCGPLLLATASYSGLPFSVPRFVPYVRGAGVALPGLALLVLLLREDLASALQLVVWAAWLLTGVLSVLLLLMDSRTYRWAPIVLWLVLLVLLWLRASAELQWLAWHGFVMHGYQAVLLLLLASMLALPWARSALQQRAMHKRKVVVEPSQEENIAKAREQLMASLQVGLGNAAEGDVQWIAFRRLLVGLKPVLPQLSSAVVAMNYHGEDLLQVEPMEAESRYRTLLEQRSSLLRGLSRSRGAQQVALDFDGDDGPLPPVQAAVIPLPVDKPGWGVLLVERPMGVSYGEDELELCTEFAALATTASEEAAVAVRAKRDAEIDPDTGVYRAELIEKMLADQIKDAHANSRPVTVMRVEIDGLEAWREHDETAANDAMRRIGAVLRDELEFGESLGRLNAHTFLMVLHGRNANVCRPVADRLMTAVLTLGLPGDLQVCIGISELRRGELTGTALIDRAGHAVIAARRSGTPATSGTT